MYVLTAKVAMRGHPPQEYSTAFELAPSVGESVLIGSTPGAARGVFSKMHCEGPAETLFNRAWCRLENVCLTGGRLEFYVDPATDAATVFSGAFLRRMHAWLDAYPPFETSSAKREAWRKAITLHLVSSAARLTSFDEKPHLLMSLLEGRNFAHLLKDNLWPVHSLLSEMLEGGFTTENQILLIEGVHDRQGLSTAQRELY